MTIALLRPKAHRPKTKNGIDSQKEESIRFFFSSPFFKTEEEEQNNYGKQHFTHVCFRQKLWTYLRPLVTPEEDDEPRCG